MMDGAHRIANNPHCYNQYSQQQQAPYAQYYVPNTSPMENTMQQTAYGHPPNTPPGAPFAFNPNADAVTNLAMQYAPAFVGQGAEMVQKNVDAYISSSKLKYYFAVNNSYVAKKLGLVLFPFAHTNWSTRFDPASPVPPGDDLNAPDLYIPLMAFITYVLATGAIMGMQSRFSPEQLGMLSSEALGWLALEVLIFLFCIYVLNIQSYMSYLDLLAFSGYKYVSMIVVLLAYVVLEKTGYYFSLIYVSVALAFFLIRTLKFKVLPHAVSYPSESSKRPTYLLLTIALVQPLVMWWLTRRTLMDPVTRNQSL